MSATSINTPIRGYINCGGEPISLAEVGTILTELEDVVKGVSLFCESRQKSTICITWEESSSLALINLGMKQILEGLSRTNPGTAV